ncbi:uncharacterized protein LOC129576713 [Sitodiplosis mosellana]|uniref:uncharacterized protein LOC129576713 n=1 Tax=Sitodiplosis mosellana TaxID=263140 RepID=UPI002444E8A1|nr:uncharacterized protein LOC129576713 [Sitodiplosis mosellana]
MKKNLVVFLLCAVTIYGCNALQHNLFYGNCVLDNNTVPIYTQVVLMDNPYAVHTPAKPVRRWYDWFSKLSFRRKTTTTPAPSIVSGKVINATVVFPPPGIKNTRLIKCIQVIDNITDGHGGFASIEKGGINQNSTQIRLTSQPGGKINSKVVIFTYKDPHTPATYHQSPFGWKTQPNAIPNHHPNQIPGSQHPSNYQHQPHKPYYPWPNLHKKK